MAPIGHMPVHARAAQHHRPRPAQVAAQVGAPRTDGSTALEPRGQEAWVGCSGVSTQAGAPRSGGHAAMKTQGLVGTWVPAQAGASGSGGCAALGTGDCSGMVAASWACGLAVAHAWAPRGGHAGVDSPAAKARTWWGVGAHCPVAGLRAPWHRVHTSHAERRPGLALWGAELLQSVVRAAVATGQRRRALVVSRR